MNEDDHTDETQPHWGDTAFGAYFGAGTGALLGLFGISIFLLTIAHIVLP